MKLIALDRCALFVSLSLLTACGGSNGSDKTKPVSDSRCLNAKALSETKIPVKASKNACILRGGIASESITLLVREGQKVDLSFTVVGNNHYADFIKETMRMKKDVQRSIKNPNYIATVHYQWKRNPETTGKFTLTGKTPNKPDLEFKGEDVTGTYRFSLYSEIHVYNPKTRHTLRKTEGPSSPRFSVFFDVDELD